MTRISLMTVALQGALFTWFAVELLSDDSAAVRNEAGVVEIYSNDGWDQLEIEPDWPLRGLSLVGSKVTELGIDICDHPTLRNVVINGAVNLDYDEIFGQIESCSSVQYLRLEDVEIHLIHSSFEKLSSLEGLTLVGCGLDTVAVPCLGSNGLQILQIEQDYLPSLPVCEAFTTLEVLILVDLKGPFVPENLEQFLGLESFVMRNNIHMDMGQVLHSLGSQETLKYLDISGSDLRELPIEVQRFVNLDELVIRGNQFIDIPPVVLELQKLKALDISNNALTRVPGWLTNLKRLRRLDLSDNYIDHLPEEFYKLAGTIGDLNLANTRLDEATINRVKREFPVTSVRF